MINLILLFLVFNLNLKTFASTESINRPRIENNKDSIPKVNLNAPNSSINNTLEYPQIDLVFSNQPIKLNSIPSTSKDIKKTPRQFSIQKNNQQKIAQKDQLIITESAKKAQGITLQTKESAVKSPIVEPKQSTKVCCKQWNIDSNPIPTKVAPKKKVGLVFMSKGGGGHISVSNALKSYLDEYEIIIANFFEDVMSSEDTIRYLTFGRASGEDIYNFCLQNRFVSLANGFTRLGAWTLRQKSSSIEPLIFDFVVRHKPDFIISVIPVVNFALLSVAKRLNIPFFVVTNDLDTTNYINGISGINYNKFYYTVSFNDRDIYHKFRSARIPKRQVAVTGFPLRPEFYEQNKNKVQIKKDFQIPADKKVVMILMGGAGSFVCYKYVKTLIRMKKPMHIVACIGRDERLRSLINGLTFPPHITISIVGFTNRVSDLMAASDVLITKAGPNSICEAMASYLPVLIDQTTGNIWWETLNVDFVLKNHIGDIVKRFKEVNDKITKFLENAEYIKSVKARMAKIQTGIDFRQRIKCLIKRVVG